MKKIVLILLAIIIGACSAKSPQSELNTTISEMLALIDKGDSKEILAKYVDLSDIKGSITDIPKSKLKRLKVYLLRAKELKPVLSEDNTLAVYNDTIFHRPFRFKKVGERWLLKNK